MFPHYIPACARNMKNICIDPVMETYLIIDPVVTHIRCYSKLLRPTNTVKSGLKAGSYTISRVQLVIRQFDRC